MDATWRTSLLRQYGRAIDVPESAMLPQRVHTPAELQNYLAHNRLKCQATIEALTGDEARRPTRPGMPFAALLLSNMRHIQEHGAQLNMFLSQQTG